MKGVNPLVNTSKKKPILYIGLIAFLVIAVIGIAYDFISSAGGVVAIISVVVAFLILAAVLTVDAISRKKAAKLEEQNEDNDVFNFDEESRFLRHTDDSAAEDSSGDEQSRFAFSRRGRSGFDDNEQQFDPQDAYSGGYYPTGAQQPGGVPGAMGGFDDADEPVPDDSQGVPDYQADPQESDIVSEQSGVDQLDDIEDVSDDEVYSFSDEELSEEADDNPFAPVLKLDGPKRQKRQPEPVAEAVKATPEAVPPVQAQAEPVVDAAETEAEIEQPAAPQPKAAAAQPEPTAEAPAPAEKKPAQTAAQRRAAAAVPAASVVSTSVGGKDIDSFYDSMSDEDILYRDCVEVWASDARPSMQKLIKIVEAMEDKQASAALGREVEYANAMIDRINYFTQLEYIDELLEYQKHNFSTLVKDCLKRFSPFFMEKRLGLLWKGLDIDVMTDRRWFIFALTQVIFNSVEFTPHGGKIAISAKKHEDYIDLSVEDSGKGISPEELPFIFMAGYMGDEAPNESGRRTGMGLFIAQSVIRKMGGEMLAESTPGKGTRITMRMPVIEPIM